MFFFLIFIINKDNTHNMIDFEKMFSLLERIDIQYKRNRQLIKEAYQGILDNNGNNDLQKETLQEGYCDDIYLSDNFKKWFNGSKMVDENGKPLLLGHATRSFGFNKFNSNFIHLSSINDASYFSGGNKRMFKFKNTINKMDDNEIINFYNKYFKYQTYEDLYLLNDETMSKILDKYENELLTIKEKKSKYFSDEEIEEKINLLNNCKNILLKRYNKYNGKLCCRPYHNGMPRLTPSGFAEKNVKLWISECFPTIKQLRDDIAYEMFKKDDFIGKGGTYALCARVLNPLIIDCHWQPWYSISIRPDNCNDYDGLFKKFCEYGLNKRNYGKGSWFNLDNETIAFFAKELGYDGVIFNNIREGADGEIGMETTYIVYSTKQLKSPFENNGDFGDVENLFK